MAGVEFRSGQSPIMPEAVRNAGIILPDNALPIELPREKIREYEGKTYVYPTWAEMGAHAIRLARQINAVNRHPDGAVDRFDKLVVIANGGYTWSRILLNLLRIPIIDRIGIKSYHDVGKQGEIEIFQPLAYPVHNENVLILDDVADGGKTGAKAREVVTVLGAKDVKLATIGYKPKGGSPPPDYYAFSTDAYWIIFPHEPQEFMDKVAGGWLENGVSPEEVSHRAVELGLPPEERSMIDELIETGGFVPQGNIS